MKQFSTDLDREPKGWEFHDDHQATKERIILFFTSMLLGIIFGIAGLMAYYSITGKTCSAYPYCTVHKTNR